MIALDDLKKNELWMYCFHQWSVYTAAFMYSKKLLACYQQNMLWEMFLPEKETHLHNSLPILSVSVSLVSSSMHFVWTLTEVKRQTRVTDLSTANRYMQGWDPQLLPH